MARLNNSPTHDIESVPKQEVSRIVGSLKELYDMGVPKNDEEISARIDEFFRFCQATGLRVGVESLALSLHVSRTTLFNWSNQIGCTKERSEIIQAAKSFIGAYLEQISMAGKLNPATSCFLYKNWLGYKDSVEIETPTIQRTFTAASELPTLTQSTELRTITTSELPQLGVIDGV